MPEEHTAEWRDRMFNFYSRGTIPISLILELFNIDPEPSADDVEAERILACYRALRPV